jgi:hypothetical protein
VDVSAETTMTKPIDPNELSRDERVRELASILAQGLARLFDATTCSPESSAGEPQIPPSEP